MLKSKMIMARDETLNRFKAEISEIHDKIDKNRSKYIPSLEKLTDRIFFEYQLLLGKKCNISPLSRIQLKIDELYKTDEIEYMDDYDFSEDKKKKEIKWLDRSNKVFATNKLFLLAIKPVLHACKNRQIDPVRVLDIGSGHGGFPITLYKMGRKRRIDLRITGSDVSPDFVRLATEKAEMENAHVDFKVIDALDLSHIATCSYDVVTCTQTIHHFSPGQLAVMINESQRIATTALMFFDGYRFILGMIFVVPLTYLFSRDIPFVRDAIVSLRRLYLPVELELIFRCAGAGDYVEIKKLMPGYFNAVWIKK